MTDEQFTRCACQCLAPMISVHDSPADLEAKAEVAVEATEALAKALSKSKHRVGPMAPQKRIGRR